MEGRDVCRAERSHVRGEAAVEGRDLHRSPPRRAKHGRGEASQNRAISAGLNGEQPGGRKQRAGGGSERRGSARSTRRIRKKQHQGVHRRRGCSSQDESGSPPRRAKHGRGEASQNRAISAGLNGEQPGGRKQRAGGGSERRGSARSTRRIRKKQHQGVHRRRGCSSQDESG